MLLSWSALLLGLIEIVSFWAIPFAGLIAAVFMALAISEDLRTP